MNILAPFDMVSEVELLINAGADELYCGLNNEYWRKNKIFSNARHMSYGNLNSFSELKEALTIAKCRGTPIFLCTNDYLPEGAFDVLIKDIHKSIDLGINGIVVADLTIIHFIKEINSGCKIILSCLNPCFSCEGISFYKDLGIDRIILPLNQLTLKEIEDISSYAQQLNIEIEVFINNIVCRNIPGNCLYNDLDIFNERYTLSTRLILSALRYISKMVPLKLRNRFSKKLFSSTLHPKPCRSEFYIEIFDKSKNRIVKAMDGYSPDKDFSQNYCGLCSIYFLRKYGITSGKIAGRGYPTDRKLKDVNFSKEYLDGIEKGDIGEDNFVEKGKIIYQNIYGKECRDKKCHYIEVRQLR